MNNQIRQVYGVVIVLFALLVAFTSYWSVLDAKGLNDNPDNRRTLIEEQTIPRGLIFARDGKTRIAINHSERRGDARVFVRDYPTGGLFAHPIGYSFIQNGRRGLESSRNDDLAGKRNEFESIFAGLEGRDREGEDVVTNLDVAGTNAAVNGLAGRKGAVVAIEPQTGKVRVMVSIPEYDPNRIPTDFHALDTDPNKPTLNRSTQELYPPGSTFKVVTATAALDTGAVTPDTVIDGSSPRTISGQPLFNSGGENFGPISLTTALTNSVNTVFAQVGEKIGRVDARRVHEALRLLRGPAARLPVRPDGAERHPPQRSRVRAGRASTSGAWRSGRAASRARSKRRRCRWPRSRRRSPTRDG